MYDENKRNREQVVELASKISEDEPPAGFFRRMINRVSTLTLMFSSIFMFLQYVVLDFIGYFMTGIGIPNLYFFIGTFYKNMFISLWKGN